MFMPKFEDQLKNLESIVDKLEHGDLPLDESIRLFEEGVKISDACKSELDAAENRVEILLKQKGGALKPENFLTIEEN